MCHSIPINYIGLDFEIDKQRIGVIIRSEIKLHGKTGAEMEALTAVSAAALTIYDMCKAVDKKMVIGEIKLVKKSKR